MTKIDDLPTQWEEYSRNPIIYPPFPAPVIADPTFLPPEQTHDGVWHLFAHVAPWECTMSSIIHFTSNDGIEWSRSKKIVCRSGLRPYVFRCDEIYYIVYERLISYFPEYHSRIEIVSSKDLANWSEPKTILQPSLFWHKEGTKLGSIGNPCIIRHKGAFRLYYSGGLVYLRDCKFSEPKYIGYATSNDILGPYVAADTPMITPLADDPYLNLGAGSVKVIEFNGGYVGFQNGIYWEHKKNRSGSAIRLLVSDEGITWKLFAFEPIIKPSNGWKKSHVYASDVRIRGNNWIMYFNARNGWFIGSEKIGQAIGKIYSK
jgi:predicted GH43/DUF377 family glycosyl hydrolase